MAHSVGEQAARAVKNSEKKSTVALRTPEERMAAIRGSVAAKLYIIPDDIQFLLTQLDETFAAYAAQLAIVHTQDALVIELQAKVEEFRTVYEQENRSQRVQVERILEDQPVVCVVAESTISHAHTEELLGMAVTVAKTVGLPGSDIAES